jgi:hypothetical protein
VSAVAACERAITAHPAELRPYLDEVYALMLVAGYRTQHWNDPTPQDVVGTARAAQALALAPASADAYVARASC